MKHLLSIGCLVAIGTLTGMGYWNVSRAESSTIVVERVDSSAASWRIDNVHSFIIFRVKHLETAWAYGRFNEMNGTIVFDPDDPAGGSIDVTVQATSVDTANRGRDDHLRGPDFFDSANFPTLAFKADGFKNTGDGYTADGQLTMLGVTRPLTVTLEHTGSGRNQRGQSLIGFETTFTIKRSEFGMNYGLPAALGDDVRLTVSIEAIQQ